MPNDVTDLLDLAETESTETTETETETDEDNGALYPNVQASYVVGDDRLDENSVPSNALTVSEFTGHLSILAFDAARTAGETDMAKLRATQVQSGAVYAATRAKRHPLPVILVYPEGTDEDTIADVANQKLAKVYVPIEEGVTAWQEKPVRGDGATSQASRRSDEDLFRVAALKREEGAALELRLVRMTERFEKVSKQVARYGEMLADRGKSWDDVDKFMSEQESTDTE